MMGGVEVGGACDYICVCMHACPCERNPCKENIYLHYVLTKQQVQSFFASVQGLKMNRTLLSLSLNSNRIGDKGAAKIAEVCACMELNPFSAMMSRAKTTNKSAKSETVFVFVFALASVQKDFHQNA